jgi:hypothetical protein
MTKLDLNGNPIEVGDTVALTFSSSLRIGVISKVNPKTVSVVFDLETWDYSKRMYVKKPSVRNRQPDTLVVIPPIKKEETPEEAIKPEDVANLTKIFTNQIKILRDEVKTLKESFGETR